MFGLRLKLLLGFGGLLAILLSLSGVGIVVLDRYQRDLNQFLSENWNSVEYGQAMVYSLNTMDDIARRIEGVGPTADRAENALGPRGTVLGASDSTTSASGAVASPSSAAAADDNVGVWAAAKSAI